MRMMARTAGVVLVGLLCAALSACGADEGGDTRNVVPPDPDVRVDSRSLGISPDGERLAAPCGAKICVWNVDDGSINDRFSGGAILAWSPEDSLIASTDGNANIVLIDADSGKHLARLSGHEREKGLDGDTGILHLAFSPDGSQLASSARDGTVRIWSVSDDEPQVLQTAPEGIRSASDLAFSDDGSRLAVSSRDASTQIWDVASGKLVHKLTGGAPAGDKVAFSPDGQWLATATEKPDWTVAVSDAASLTIKHRFDRDVYVYDLTFSPDGSLLAFNDREGRDIVLWPTSGGEPRVLSDGLTDMPESLQFSPDGRFLYSIGGKDGIVKWRADDGTRLEQFELPDPRPSTSH